MRNAPKFSGKTAAARLAAFENESMMSFNEALSREAHIANAQTALGKRPSDKLLDAFRDRFVVGKVAQKLAGKDTAARLKAAEIIVFDKATPVKKGTTPRKLGKDKVGRRTDTEHKAVRAAITMFSLFKADCGYSDGVTLKEKNEKARKGKAPKPGTNAPDKVNSSDDVCKHINLQSEALLAFVNKHAGKVPLAYGEAVHAFRNAIIAASKSPAKK